jgi:hypothetical protein
MHDSSERGGGDTIPAGYEQLRLRGTMLVGRREQIPALRAALEAGTLYAYAAHHERARPLSGRGVAFAVPLPNGERVVVRHNRHGGLLAPLTGDRFVVPTRAPYELAVALRLTRCGVPTPEIVGYAAYDAGPLLRRSDVASREVRDSVDLAAILTTEDATERRAALDATATVISLLSACGARHHDLNVKNVLIARAPSPNNSPSAPKAYVLDVDRVEFGRPGDSRVTERNLARFVRSARKWRELYGARVDDGELARLAAAVRRLVGSTSSAGTRDNRRS